MKSKGCKQGNPWLPLPQASTWPSTSRGAPARECRRGGTTRTTSGTGAHSTQWSPRLQTREPLSDPPPSFSLRPSLTTTSRWQQPTRKGKQRAHKSCDQGQWETAARSSPTTVTAPRQGSEPRKGLGPAWAAPRSSQDPTGDKTSGQQLLRGQQLARRVFLTCWRVPTSNQDKPCESGQRIPPRDWLTVTLSCRSAKDTGVADARTTRRPAHTDWIDARTTRRPITKDSQL